MYRTEIKSIPIYAKESEKTQYLKSLPCEPTSISGNRISKEEKNLKFEITNKTQKSNQDQFMRKKRNL